MYHDVPLVADSFVVWDPPTGPSNWGYVWQFFGVSRNYGTMVIKAISWDMGSLTTVFFLFRKIHWFTGSALAKVWDILGKMNGVNMNRKSSNGSLRMNNI